MCHAWEVGKVGHIKRNAPRVVIGQYKVVANGLILLPDSRLAIVPIPHVNLSVPTIYGAMVYKKEREKERGGRGRKERNGGEEVSASVESL